MILKPNFALQDEALLPFLPQINHWLHRFRALELEINHKAGSLYDYASSHHYFGVHRLEGAAGRVVREYAPAAYSVFLIGDFNNWNRNSHPFKRNAAGDWEIFLSDELADGRNFCHNSLYKIHIFSAIGRHDRLPSHVRRVVKDEQTHDFSAQLWQPAQPYQWKNANPALGSKPWLIYEAHVGMAQEALGIGSYQAFEEHILPRIVAAGYNVLQLMAVQEHPYYGSFGYHVSNFFAVSSRFGTPEELKSLIDTAHGLGLKVIMDIVHSHAVRNLNEGLDRLDGTDNMYFYGGDRGLHPLWDSKLFDYSRPQTLKFLLSNVRYWLEEFRFDGFRFDGVTSMLYHDHGINRSFDSLEAYFGDNIDIDALNYLRLANLLAAQIRPELLSIAEDVSGMPGLASPISQGGIGFSARLAMGVPDFWIKTIKEQADEHWSMSDFWHTLTNRRYQENTIAYVESHDQALVGDQTLAFRLMHTQMYDSMGISSQNIVVDRGIALHKIIRLLTCSLAGDGYLNFMGNEFGHPDWIDFPRLGNDWSYQYARRLWSLSQNPELKYHFLLNFDHAMIDLILSKSVLQSKFAKLLIIDEENKILIFERGDLIFAFNFHANNSVDSYSIQAHRAGYKIVLSSDEADFGGFERINSDIVYPTNQEGMLQIYLPSRSALVFEKQ